MPDKYNTCMLVAFLQQLLTFNGFYNSELEFLGLERIQIVVSINPATTIGRAVLSTRYTAITRIAYMDYPTEEELNTIYSIYIQASLASLEMKEPHYKKPDYSLQLSQTLVAVYSQLKGKFSIDERRHYLLTPRDLSNIVQGLVRYDLQNESILDVCVNEFNRIFRDRIVDLDSCLKYDSIVEGIFQTQWRYTSSIRNCYFTSLDSESRELSLDNSKMLIRCEKEIFEKKIENGIVKFAKEECDLGLVIFPEFLTNITKIDRVLSQKKGNLLLIGDSGVGRRTLITLVSFMTKSLFYTPSIVRFFNFAHLCEQLKEPFRKAGEENEQVILFLDDIRLDQNSVMDSINSLLSSNEISGMYKADEIIEISNSMKDLMSSKDSFKNPFEFFMSRVQQNLHIVLSMNPNDSDFIRKCESNPAFTTYCTIQWMGTWKDETLEILPRLLLNNLISTYPKKGILESLIVSIHNTTDSTPRDFITFLKSYEAIYNLKYNQIQQEIEHLNKGLMKLREASNSVDILSQEAEVQRIKITESQNAADTAMIDITNTLNDAGETRLKVEELQNELSSDEKLILERKNNIEDELSEIKPQMDSAKKAVSGIKSDNLNEIKSFANPPEAIADVLSAVLQLLGYSDISWSSMKIFLSDRSVLNRILNFDPDQITPNIRKECLKIVKNKSSSFEQENIRRASVAAAPLAAWVKAILRYSVVLEKIWPLTNELNKAEKALEESRKKLETNKNELNLIDEKVNKLKQKFQQKTQEAEELKTKYKETELVLSKAQHLLNQLSGEQERWKQKSISLGDEIKSLFSKMLLAAGYNTYMGKLSEDKREDLLKQWCNIIEIESFDFSHILSSESEMLLWKTRELPADILSVENAIIILNSKERTPFIIDPSSVSSSWLEKELKSRNKQPSNVVSLNIQDPRFANQVELAVRFGKTLIINDVDGIESMLYNLIKKQFIQQGSRRTIIIGDHNIDYNEDFQLYLCSRNPNPKLTPDGKSIVTEINFTVTRSGLEGQLLGVTIQHERPELEKKKSEMLKKEEDLKLELAGLEKLLLETLADSKGSLIENTTLITSLTETKTKSADIIVALTESANSSAELDKERSIFRPFAQEGSKLFFLVQNMISISHMYQYSLSSFIKLFQDTLDEKIENYNQSSKRIDILIPILIEKVLFYVSKSLFKSHQLLWSIFIIHGMKPEYFEPQEWELFIGEIVPDPSQVNSRELPSWVPSESASNYFLIKNSFKNVFQKGGLSSDEWKSWISNAECEKNFPKIGRKLSSFEKILILQAFRPDHLLSGLNDFACEKLGLSSINPPPFSISEIYEQNSESSLPILIITTTGADPSDVLREFAISKIGKDHFKELAMGGGQQEEALKLLNDASVNGDWLFLKNLHLVVSWLPVLEKSLNNLKPHKNFRLWLTTETHNEFPSNLLQQCVKFTLESPPGIKKNIQQSLLTWNIEEIKSSSTVKVQLLFLLSLFHAIIQERRTYIPQGWSIFYEFSSSDLKIGNEIISLVLELDQTNPNYKMIHGLLALSVYGNRISNTYDFNVLLSYIKQFFNSKMLQGGNLLNLFNLPQSNVIADYYRNINKLKDTDSPNVFGLPLNIERSVQRVVSGEICELLSRLSKISVKTEIFDKDKWKVYLVPIFELWSKISNSKTTILTKMKNPFNKNDTNPIQNFM